MKFTRFGTINMQTLEELNAHYKAVRERINSSKPVQNAPPLKVETKVEEVLVIKDQVVEEPIVEMVIPQATMPKNSAQEIVAMVAAKHGMNPKDLKGDSRKAPYVVARREAAYIMKRDLGLSLTLIGRALGNKDHTSVINMLRKYAIHNNAPPLTTCKGKP